MRHLSLALTLLLWTASVAGQVPEPAAPSHAVAASNAARGWQPSEAQRERVLRDVQAYFTAKDEGRYGDAYAHFAPSQKSSVPFEQWKANLERFYGQAGSREGRSIRRVTWYHHPANAPAGVYAAVDFSGAFSGLGLYCGYVALREQMDGSFAVAREEENSIPKDLMAKLSPDALKRVQAEFRC
ncbi:MAG: DUF4019 domain-containing protein [Inhella sp.]|jgi:hypothetical protein|uniref:DUF4019 domain-containing protein n=1 Tax=Inhella sp. TaxID=1921806 RepID=UPI0022C13DCD|nr:DUF4019 domain-containing protein [Inhella sp.]MCZ8235576.1 DUF4019 domain-containing protein [Inhella sp.]